MLNDAKGIAQGRATSTSSPRWHLMRDLAGIKQESDIVKPMEFLRSQRRLSVFVLNYRGFFQKLSWVDRVCSDAFLGTSTTHTLSILISCTANATGLKSAKAVSPGSPGFRLVPICTHRREGLNRCTEFNGWARMVDTVHSSAGRG